MTLTSGLNLFGNIPAHEYQRVIKLVEEAILATDLAIYLRHRGKFTVDVSYIRRLGLMW